MLKDYPAFVRLYDLLLEDGDDLRPLPFVERRARLEAFLGRERPPRMDLSPLVPFAAFSELEELRLSARAEALEGLMLKRRDSAYVAGRVKGLWWKWKRDPHALDVVLMYAQRGHGKRSSFYSDYTFGCWRDAEQGPELVPVGKAYFGFTDEELRQLDRWVRDHTTRRVRAGARGGAAAGARGGVRFGAPLDPPQVGRRHAFSARGPDPLGQARGRGRQAGVAGADDRLSRWPCGPTPLWSGPTATPVGREPERTPGWNSSWRIRP